MATIIKAFTAKEPDICVKCGKPIAIGQEISWLRDAERVGYFHVEERSMETIMALTKVRVTDPGAQLGWRWVRERDRGTAHPAIYTPVLPVLSVSRDDKPQAQPTAISKEIPSEVSTDGIIVAAVAKALLPAIGKMIADAKGPRIVCNIYVNKSGEEIEALNSLSKELTTYSSMDV